MAKKGGKSKKSSSSGWNPLTPSFNTQAEFMKAVRERARGITQPQIQALKQERGTARATHQGRAKDIRNYYGYYGNELGQAYHDTVSSLNDLLAQRTASSSTAQANLAAALERSRAADRAQATQVGGEAAPATTQEGTLESVFAGGESGLNELGTQFGATEAEARGRESIAGLGRLRSLEDEQGRQRATVQDILRRRQGVIMSIPQIREQMRKQVLEEEVSKAAELARERIAAQSLKLDQAKLNESAREFNATLGLNYAQLNLDKQKLKADVAAASGAGKGAQAKAWQDKFNGAVKIMTDYLQGTKAGARNPHALLSQLTGLGHLTHKRALHVMASYGQGYISNWAKQHLGGHKGQNKFTKKSVSFWWK